MARVVPLFSGIAYGAPLDRSAAADAGSLPDRLLRAMRARVRERRANRELRRLTDHQLRDIGLERTEIAESSWGATAWEDVARLSLRSHGPGR